MEPARSTRATVAADGELALELAAVSDRGAVRADNQDAWGILALHPRPGGVLMVADGMGGHAGGAEAAALAIRHAGEHLQASVDPHGALRGAVEAANTAISRLRQEHDDAVMGTTLVAAVVSAARTTVVNVGDCRAYVVRDGVASQVTVDHSLLAEGIRAGLVDAQQAEQGPARSILTRALTGEAVGVDEFAPTLEAGDVLLLCCDGVWGALSDDRLGELVRGGGPLDLLLASICDAALAAGSTDNVTVVGCRIGAARTG